MKKILGILLVMAVLLCNVALASNLDDSKAMFDEAVATLMTTDNHPMLAPGVTFDVPEAVGTYEELVGLIMQRFNARAIMFKNQTRESRVQNNG